MGRQAKLPGTTRPDEAKPIEDIERAAEAYAKAAAASSKQRKKTGEAKEALIAVMKANDRTVYKAEDGRTYTLVAGKEKVTIAEPGEEDSGGEDDESGAE